MTCVACIIASCFSLSAIIFSRVSSSVCHLSNSVAENERFRSRGGVKEVVVVVVAREPEFVFTHEKKERLGKVKDEYLNNSEKSEKM